MARALKRTTLVAAAALLALSAGSLRADEPQDDAFAGLSTVDERSLAEHSGKYTEDSFNIVDSYKITQDAEATITTEQSGNDVVSSAGDGTSIMSTGNIGAATVSNAAGLTTLMQTTGHNNTQIYNVNVNVSLY